VAHKVQFDDIQPGASVTFKDKVPWAVARKSALIDGNDWSKFMTILKEDLILDWNLQDLDGKQLPPPKQCPIGLLDNVDADIVQRIFDEAGKMRQAGADLGKSDQTPSSGS
jgi:hypothetical protein